MGDNQDPFAALPRFLRSVVDPQDFNALLLHAVHHDVGQRQKQKLAGSFLTSHAATMRPLFQGADTLVELTQSRLTVLEMAIFQAFADVLQIRCGGGRPADTHL